MHAATGNASDSSPDLNDAPGHNAPPNDDNAPRGSAYDAAHSPALGSAPDPARAPTPRRQPDGSGSTCDVLVIGGGVIGLVTAWRAAQRGLRVTVADPAPGGGAAQVAAGMLAAVTELHYGEQTLLGLNLSSARRYPAFAAELEEAGGQDIGYRTCGTLAVALDSDDRAHLRELHDLQRRSGLESQWLTGRECRRLEPMLAPGVRGGLRVDGDHQTDPRRLTAALLTACERAGVTFRRAWAQRLSVVRDRAAGAVLDDGTRIDADQVVLAGGSLSGRLAGVPDAVLPPVRPVKGQILRLRVPAALSAHAPFLSRTVRATVRGGHVYLVPRENGELVLGATSEELGWDTTVTAGGVYELLRDAHELVPGITELPLVETRAGLRPCSPDNAPLLGPTALPGLHLATGHHRNGVLLTPITGDVMAEVLTTGELPDEARPFSPQRFAPASRETPAQGLSTAGTAGTAGTGDPAHPSPGLRPGDPASTALQEQSA
ncbi:glycine oxidase ThiO [Streptomyces sp. H27-D2]|uniref:glycine oxidase ThiO n=1 Tax=Streptomyces sp. H27-D2 TaxID=3046304 RepID=UPI002DBFE650|nr:glycine oxidase ThiO [Streptomyces sp. H27-D2]MEC4018939.1 glycine oxidase ThiO [Streptomyces sp. H27-D2]